MQTDLSYAIARIVITFSITRLSVAAATTPISIAAALGQLLHNNRLTEEYINIWVD